MRTSELERWAREHHPEVDWDAVLAATPNGAAAAAFVQAGIDPELVKAVYPAS